MAIISTRVPSGTTDEQFLNDLRDELQRRIDRVLGSSAIQVTADKSDLMTSMIGLIEGYEKAALTMVSDIRAYQLTNAVLQVEIAQASATIHALTTVPYDGALDSAVTELMDVLTSTVNGASMSPDNTLIFDGRQTIGKGDLKPVLREAITRWIDQRLA